MMTGDMGEIFNALRKDRRRLRTEYGINCAVFRNEGPHLSSELIRQADAIADCLWPDRRHYTYVDRSKVASANPGFCFLRAGWRRCGVTKGGLVILERAPEQTDPTGWVAIKDAPAKEEA